MWMLCVIPALNSIFAKYISLTNRGSFSWFIKRRISNITEECSLDTMSYANIDDATIYVCDVVEIKACFTLGRLKLIHSNMVSFLHIFKHGCNSGYGIECNKLLQSIISTTDVFTIELYIMYISQLLHPEYLHQIKVSRHWRHDYNCRDWTQ